MTDQQASNIIRLKRKRRRRSKIGAPGRLLAFPPARHRKIVAYVAKQMRRHSSLDAAEEALVDHLWIEANRLSDLGVIDDEIERFCRDFARAAWKIVLQDQHTWGAA
jgi:hypothetical protein